MFAFDDLFRFTAKYPQLVYRDILSDIQEEAEYHLAGKAYLGIFLIPLCFVAVSLSVGFYHEYFPYFSLLFSFFIISVTLRFRVLSKIRSEQISDRRKYFSLFVISCAITGATWGVSVALFLLFYGTTYPLYLMVMATCGICAGSIAGFGSFRKLVWLYMLIMTLPLLCTGIWIGIPETYGVIAVASCFLVYMMLQANYRNREYWNGLIKSHLFEAQAVELSNANNSLAQKMAEQEEYQNELKVSREKLRYIFDNSHDAIVIHDMNGLVLDINRTMIEMFGIVDVERLDIAMLKELSAPGFSYEGLKELVDKVMVGEEVNFEWHAKKQDTESYFWVQVNMRRVVWHNDPIIFSSIRNIDEQKRAEIERDLVKHSLVKSEAYLHALLENISRPIFCKSLDGEYVTVNRHFEALVNETIENIEGRTDFDLYPRDVAANLLVSDTNVKDSKRSVDSELKLETDGGHRYYLISKFPLLDENEDLIAIGGVCTDITDIKDAYDEMEEANRIKGDFLANIAHELRTPMHGILSFARLAIKRMHTTSRENILSYLHMVLTSGEHLLDLLDNLIELNRYDHDRATYHFEEGHFVEQLVGIINELQGIAEEKKIELVFEDNFSKRHDAAGLLLAYDRGRIQQVLRNLIANAIKFSEPDTIITVQVDASSSGSKKEKCLLVKVIDHGCGIPTEEWELVFESYVRGNATRTARLGGSGLGLAICKKIIDDHGGKIWIEQNPAGGAVFLFTLPFTG